MTGKLKRRSALAVAALLLLAVGVPWLLLQKTLLSGDSSPRVRSAVSTEPSFDAGPSPTDTIFAMNDSWARNQPNPTTHLPGTPAEEEYSAAVRSILTAQSRMLAAFKTKLDPNDITTLPPAAFYIKPIEPWLLRDMKVSRIDPRTADVTIPGYPRYHMVLVNGRWLIQVSTTIASVYPADPDKALQILTLRFHGIASGFDSTTAEIMNGTLASSDAIVAAVADRIKKANDIGTAEMPPYHDLTPPKTA